MAYIGKTPTVGNFVKLDALTASATASYTMQVDSVNFSPESVNHMLVSLNGVIQSPTTSYTISGSTITFASALTSSDSIDFIMVYGNVLDIGTPSDATVTNAKTNFVSTSSAAGLQIKGDGTTDGTLQLNCSQNSHGIKLKSPPHSASASYTLTFPNNDGDANQFLQSNGSGVLTWADGGGSFAPDNWQYFVISANQTMSANASTTISGWSGGAITSRLIYNLGTQYVTESSGTFSFSTEGYFRVILRVSGSTSGSTDSSGYIFTTTDNSSYGDAVDVNFSKTASGGFNFYLDTILKITDTSNHKVRTAIYAASNNITVAGHGGNATRQRTYIRFERLGTTAWV